LACALESKADYVVSGDKHLRQIKHFHSVRIIDVKTFVERVRKE
jgi:predicted nucleic acid-binding protein